MHEESLRQLIANCQRPSGRIIGFPHEWTPHKVELPHLPGFFFSDAGAWDLIAENLAADHLYEEIVLNSPPNAIAICMLINIGPTKRPLYVKVQLGPSNKAIGRSFHYSHP